MPDSKHEEIDFDRELQVAIDLIVKSNHRRKIVVAGPGAGKTSLFKKLLSKSRAANQNASHLVVTFISALAEELRHDLSEFADVGTFHAHCKQLLHQNPYLREGLIEEFRVFPKLPSFEEFRVFPKLPSFEEFRVFPKLPSLIKSDWSALNPGGQAPPHFVKLMREVVGNSGNSGTELRELRELRNSGTDGTFPIFPKFIPSRTGDPD